MVSEAALPPRVTSSVEFAIALTAGAIATWRVWPWYLARMRDGSDDKWCLVALAAAVLIIIFQSGTERARAIDWRAPLALLGVYAVTAWAAPPIFRALAALLFVGHMAAAWRMGPGPHWGLYALLTLATPAGASLQFALGFPLRIVAGEAAAMLLRLAGLTVETQGTGLLWAGKVAQVDAPCSGVKMLVVSLVAAAALSAWHRFEFRRFFAVMGIALGSAMAANIFRVSALFLPETGLLDLPGWTHPAVGVTAFAIAGLFILIAVDRAREFSR